MNKLVVVAFAGLMGLGIAAAVSPASAETLASCRDSVVQNHDDPGSFTNQIDSNSASIMSAMRDKGINVQDITDWNGCIKADVLQKNGHVAMQFFDPDTLQRVHRS